MARIFLALVLLPAAMLVLWFGMPPIKIMMESTVEGWGAEVGLSGFALLLATMMPIIVPVMCFAAIIAGIIGIVKGRSNI